MLGSRSGLARRNRSHRDRRHELVTAAVRSANEPRCFRVIREQLTGATDAAGEHALAHDVAGPETIQQLGLGNDAAVMSHQIAEELEHFWLGSEQILAHSHLPAPRLEHHMVTGIAKKGHSDWTRYPERSMGGSP